MAPSHGVFTGVFGIIQVVFCILFSIVVDYNTDLAAGTIGTVFYSYQFYTNVALMIFIGFGFLMTFLAKYAHSAVGFTFMLTCFTMQLALLVIGLFDKIGAGNVAGDIKLDVTHLTRSLFTAGAVMISFGAVIGRASPIQLLVMTIFEVFLQIINEYIGVHSLKAVDIGGSMFVHTFGAYFGLAVSWALEARPKKLRSKTHKFNGSRYDSDVTAMIGTLILWIMWPSFNGALASSENDQIRVVVNTVIALTSSCTWSFLASHVFNNGRFDMVHIQNATLAGGIGVGTIANLIVGPGGAMIIGAICGVVSVVGYQIITPMLLNCFGLQDTCGVHNLHGLPGIIGGITGAIACAAVDADTYGAEFIGGKTIAAFGDRTPSEQWPYQVYALLITLGISIGSGLITGFVMRSVPKHELHYQDSEFWTMAEGEEEHNEDEDAGKP